MTTPNGTSAKSSADTSSPTTPRRPDGHRGQPLEWTSGRRDLGHGQRHQLDRRHGRPLRLHRGHRDHLGHRHQPDGHLAGGTGTVDVTVTTPNGTSAINAPSDQFTYNAPATPENTTTSLTVPTLTFGAEGAPAAFTGTVAGPASADGIPAGTVTVYDNYGVAGQTQLCQTTLSGGSGDSVNYSCSLASSTTLPAGPYTNVVASYSGGSSSNTSFTYNASTSSPQSLTVSPATTSANNLKINCRRRGCSGVSGASTKSASPTRPPAPRRGR